MKTFAGTACVIVALVLCFGIAQAATEAEINQAIADGMAWLAAQQNGDGSWGTYEHVAVTGLALKKFEHHAVEDGFNPLDPAYSFYAQVKGGLDYIFSEAATIAIAVQAAGDPDSDGDGIGVYFPISTHNTYNAGIALMAIAESNCPDSVVDVTGSAVDGWTYYDVAVDIVDYLAFGQNDAGAANPNARGGWGYTHNSGAWSDNSNSGYATLGLAFAQAAPPYGFSIPIPVFVLNELSIWIDYIQCDVAGPGSDDGGSGYDASCSWVNTLKTGNLLFEMALRSEYSGDRVDRAVAYLVRHWADPDPDPGWQLHYQAMYCIMKGAEFQGLDMFDGIDWYFDFADQIVTNQQADGSWISAIWGNDILATSWALLTLEKAAPPPIGLVPVDIKPESCPNAMNIARNWESSTAVLPVAILGTEDFDVTGIDPASVMLEGVAPLRWSYEDVSTPVGPDPEECECNELAGDGYLDLTLKFLLADVVATFSGVADGDVLELFMTGMTFDSLQIQGSDCVLLRFKGNFALRIDANGSLPTEFALSQNYPNPFNPTTMLSFALPEGSNVLLEVYNVLGQKVSTLVDGYREAGYHSVEWDGSLSASGVYLYRITTDYAVESKKMLLLK